jgi:hypothetical protein
LRDSAARRQFLSTRLVVSGLCGSREIRCGNFTPGVDRGPGGTELCEDGVAKSSEDSRATIVVDHARCERLRERSDPWLASAGQWRCADAQKKMKNAGGRRARLTTPLAVRSGLRE